MVKSIVIEKFGNSDVLVEKDTPINLSLAKDEVLVRNTALGINFLDIKQRTGEYPIALPGIIGCEGCGVIEALGEDVKELAVGDRVGYATIPNGAYTEKLVLKNKYLIPVPDYISDEMVVSLLLKGMTAFTYLRRTFFVTNKHTILIYAAAGGVGQLLCSMAKHFGAKVIAAVGTEEKKKIVQSLKVDLACNYVLEDLVAKIHDFTKGNGVHGVYDSIGKVTFQTSLDALCDFGVLISFGSSSGDVEPFDIKLLAPKSLFLTRPSLFTYKKDRGELLLTANEVFTLAEKKLSNLRYTRRITSLLLI